MSVTTLEEQREAWASYLRGMIPRGSTVYTICRRVAPSGMSAAYSLVVFTPHGALHPNYSAASLIGRRLVDVNGCQAIKMPGCGYSRPAALVEELARALYDDDRALRQEAL